MIEWLRRLRLRAGPLAPPALAPAAEVPSPLPDLLEAIQKSARAQARLGARLDAIESKLEGGFADLRAAIAAAPARDAAPGDTSSRSSDLLDAMDLLDAAVAALGPEADAVADGLRGVLARLDRHLARIGLVRMGAPPELADGRLFRVVGSERRGGLADGAVARLVRAAVLEGDRVVREGEVIINRGGTE